MELGLSTDRIREFLCGAAHGVSGIETVRDLLHSATENGIRILYVFAMPEDPHFTLKHVLAEEKQFAIIVNVCGVQKDVISEQDVHDLENSFWKKLGILGMERAAGIILEHPGDLFVSGGDMVYATLQHLKDEGFVRQIGISVSTGEEIDRYLYHYDFDIMRLPLNVLDQRLLRSGHIAKLKANDIDVHVESPFLEGALLTFSEKADKISDSAFSALREYRLFLEREHLTPLEGALGFLRAQPELDVIIIEARRTAELQEIVHAFTADLSISGAYADFAVKGLQNIDISKRQR